MLKVENQIAFGFAGAVRGMRNPLNSWNRSDSGFDLVTKEYSIGPNDLGLIMRLTKAGKDHRKVLRMMHIQMDVTAPLYWWKDYDTYKVGTVANSCSTMHKITSRPLTVDDFSIEDLTEDRMEIMNKCIESINGLIQVYNDGNMDKQTWREIIQMLPSAFNQKRTIDLNYEVALAILHARRYHKLTEFHTLCDALLELPYMAKIFEASLNGGI